MASPKPLPPQNPDGSYSFTAGMAVDADGANGADGSGRAAYGPPGTRPLDYLANAGSGRGNWWGVVMDSHGNPVVQGPQDPAPGYFISTTSYQRSVDGEGQPLPRTSVYRYLDSATEFFIVVPSHWRSLARGVVLGCKATITDTETDKSIDGLVGDFGPRSHLGEASIAYASEFGLNANPKTGGTEQERFLYTFWPDVPADGYELQPM
jgi:hypothetical protein